MIKCGLWLLFVFTIFVACNLETSEEVNKSRAVQDSLRTIVDSLIAHQDRQAELDRKTLSCLQKVAFGSHPDLTLQIKSELTNPGSYEVKTVLITLRDLISGSKYGALVNFTSQNALGVEKEHTAYTTLNTEDCSVTVFVVLEK